MDDLGIAETLYDRIQFDIAHLTSDRLARTKNSPRLNGCFTRNTMAPNQKRQRASGP
jgi:hypothetical protein